MSDEAAWVAIKITFKRRRSEGGRRGGKHRWPQCINIRIHYEPLFIDPQVLFLLCRSVFRRRCDAKTILNCSGLSLGLADGQFTAAGKGLAMFGGSFSSYPLKGRPISQQEPLGLGTPAVKHGLSGLLEACLGVSHA